MCGLRSTRLIACALALGLSGAGSLRAQPTWQLGSAPVTRIEDNGTDPTIFQRIAGATRLPNGSILVAESRASELRLFAANGTFERLVARKGSGPNELPAVRWIARAGNAVFVATNGVQIVRYDVHTLKETERTGTAGPTNLSRPYTMGLLGNGNPFGTRASFRAMDEPVTEVWRGTTAPRVASTPNGSMDRELGERLGSSSLMLESSTAPMGFRGGEFAYGHHFLTAPATNLLWFGDSGTPWIGRMDSRTGRMDSTQLALAARPWDDDTIDRLRQRIQSEIPDAGDREMPLAQLDRKWRPAVRPYYRALYADINDGAWVELFREDARTQPTFLVLDSAGRTVARLNAPTALRVLEIGADYVLGSEKDADDVESVVLYRLQR